MKNKFVLKSLIIFIISFGESQEESKEWTYYESGKKKTVHVFEDGKDNDGIFTECFENGQKMGEGPFKDGRRDGLWIEKYPEGQKESEVTYKGGKKNGKNIFYNKDGSMKQ